MRQFTRLGWHISGLTWDQFLDLTIYQSYVLHDELADIIDRTAVRPKDLKR